MRNTFNRIDTCRWFLKHFAAVTFITWKSDNGEIGVAKNM